MNSGSYVIQFCFDLGDFGHHEGMVSGSVITNEFGHHIATIRKAVVFMEGRPAMDVEVFLLKSVKVDIEEQLTEKHQTQMGHRQARAR